MIDEELPVRVTLDDDADAAYIYLAPAIAAGGVARTLTFEHPHSMINIDLDLDGRVLGMEIVGAGRTLPRHLLDRLRRR